MVVVEKSKRDDFQAALYLWVTQTRQVREYGAVDDFSTSENLSIPTSLLLSKAQTKQGSSASRQTNTTKTDEFTILGIPTNGSTSLLQLMAQDIYTVFINRVADIVGDLRGTGDPEDYLTMRDHSPSTASQATTLFELTNPHIDALANALVSAGVATREEALMSIVPAFLCQMKLPLLDEDMVENLLNWAKSLRRDSKFSKGAALISWMLSKCPARFHKQGLRCLGDLYRRAALSKKRGDQELGLSGMRDMKKRHAALVSDPQTHDILSCYENLRDFFHDRTTPKRVFTDTNAQRAIQSEVYRLRQSKEQGIKAKIGQWDLELALTFSEQFYIPSNETELLTIIEWAIGGNFPELIEDLWLSARPPKETNGNIPLLTALDHECELETIHSLLDWPGMEDPRSPSPLVCAIEANRADVVCSVLRRGAYLNQRDSDGMTPLQRAFRKSNQGMIRFLLKIGAVIQNTEKYEQSALHLAAEANSEAVVQWLLKKGADIQQKDKNGRTSLHCAAEKNSEAVVRLLLENQADTHVRDERGQTA